MLSREARWLAAQLRAVGCEALSPVLDVGSGTSELRTEVQPWLEGVLLGPLRAAGCAIDHLDRFPGPGIDLVVDVTSASAMAGLARRGYRSVMCCNLLEHVSDPVALGGAIVEIVAPGGYVAASCPRRFPYHPDPIDTMLRPTVDELAGLFPGAELVAGEVVAAGTLAATYVSRVLRSARFLRRGLGHGGAAGTPVDDARPLADTVRWLFRRLTVTCVILRKPA